MPVRKPTAFPSALLLALAVVVARLPADEPTAPPFQVAPALFDATHPADLGLKPAPGTRTVTIYQSGADGPHYHNGVVLLPFKGRLYAQWQASTQDEDSPDTHVLYSWSDDGEHWSAPRALVPKGTGGSRHSSGGWWTDGTTLVAYFNVWDGETAQGGHAEYLTSKDGEHWSDRLHVLDRDGAPMNGVIEQDPHALPDGRIITAFHLQPGLVATPCYTDEPTGTRAWNRGLMISLPHNHGLGRELEPSWFVRRDGTVVMVFRDQASNFRLLAAKSSDRGATWTTPALTNMPDARSKQSAGNLPDGTAFLVGAPSGNRDRFPLVVTLSRDGLVFDRAFLLRAGTELPPLRYAGKYKRAGYHYPKSVIWNGRLLVAYATNKEDVQMTVVPLDGLVK